jgi:hypothetical protein
MKRAAQAPRLDLPVESNLLRNDSCLRGNQKAPLLITLTLTPAAYYPHACCLLPSRLLLITLTPAAYYPHAAGATPPPPPYTGK